MHYGNDTWTRPLLIKCTVTSNRVYSHCGSDVNGGAIWRPVGGGSDPVGWFWWMRGWEWGVRLITRAPPSHPPTPPSLNSPLITLDNLIIVSVANLISDQLDEPTWEANVKHPICFKWMQCNVCQGNQIKKGAENNLAKQELARVELSTQDT